MKNSLLKILGLAGLMTLSLATSNLYALPVVLDTTFGVGGIMTTSMRPDGAEFRDVVTNNNGVYAGGYSGPRGTNRNINEFIVKYRFDGTLDPSFGVSGIITNYYGLEDSSVTSVNKYSMALQADGKLITLSATHHDLFYGSMLARYLPNGTIDSSFGSAGVVPITETIDVRGLDGTIFHQGFKPIMVAIQQDGKILVMAQCSCSSLVDQIGLAVIRFKSNGTRDNTFAEYGRFFKIINERYSHTQVASLIVLNDGGILVHTGSRFVLKLTASGMLDTSFGDNGISTLDLSGGDFRVSLNVDSSSNKIYYAYLSNYLITSSEIRYKEVLARLNMDGAPDISFGTAGRVFSPVVTSGTTHSNYFGIVRLLIQSNKIFLIGGLGLTGEAGPLPFAVMGFDTDGHVIPLSSTGGPLFTFEPYPVFYPNMNLIESGTVDKKCEMYIVGGADYDYGLAPISLITKQNTCG